VKPLAGLQIITLYISIFCAVDFLSFLLQIRLKYDTMNILKFEKTGRMMMNIFNLPQLPLTEELTTILAESKNIRIERIISTGHTSDWYDQSETEFVVLLEGNATLEFENNRFVELTKGDTILIKPHERHRVVFTSTEPHCVWFCVFWSE